MATYERAPWWTARYRFASAYYERIFALDGNAVFGRVPFFDGEHWEIFPKALYPSQNDLPTRRREIELYPEHRRNLQR